MLGAALSCFLLPVPATADFLVFASPVTVAPGGSGSFDVSLTNTGSQVQLSADSFELSLSSPDVTFTDADTLTANPYVFPSADSFDLLNSFTLWTQLSPTLIASDLSDSGVGIALATGETVGLGRVTFQVASGATTGSFDIVFVGIGTSLADTGFNGLPVTFSETPSQITISEPTGVPEPSSLFFLPVGLCLLWLLRRIAGGALARLR